MSAGQPHERTGNTFGRFRNACERDSEIGGRTRTRTLDPLIKRYPTLADFCGFSESDGWNAPRQVKHLQHAIPNKEKLNA